MTAQQLPPTESPAKGTRARSDRVTYAVLITVALVLSAAIAAAAYYQDELRVWFQGGWNRGAIAGVATQFIARVQRQDYEGALALVDSERYRPIREGDRLIGLEKIDPLSRDRYEFARMFPEGAPKVTAVEWTNADGGAHMVTLEFPDGRQARFLIQRVSGTLKITQLLG